MGMSGTWCVGNGDKHKAKGLTGARVNWWVCPIEQWAMTMDVDKVIDIVVLEWIWH